MIWQLHIKFHLRGSGFLKVIAIQIFHGACSDASGLAVRTNDFQFVASHKFIAKTAKRQTVFITAFHNGADLPLSDISGMFGILPRLAVIEAGGVYPVGNMIYFIQPNGLGLSAGIDIVDYMAVRTGDNGGVISGFCTAFDFDAIDSCVYEIF